MKRAHYMKVISLFLTEAEAGQGELAINDG